MTGYSKNDLLALGKPRILKGRNLDRVAFPLGGIGTGSVALGGWGQLRDWEIANRPAKGAVLNDAFFTLKLKTGSSSPVVKVLQGPGGGDLGFHGFSAPNNAGEQLPHFRRCTFTGTFPLARVDLADERVPLAVSLEAFNPFIPLNDLDSSIPVAILRYHLKNTGRRPVSGTLYGNLSNKIGDREGVPPPKKVNELRTKNGLTGLWLAAEGIHPASPRSGSMVLATPWPDADVCPRWKANHLLKFWDMVTETDALPKQGAADVGTVAARFTLAPGAAIVIPFFLAWHFPNFEWFYGADLPDSTTAAAAPGSAPVCSCNSGSPCGSPPGPDTKKATWKNYYATVWSDAWDVAAYVAANQERLYQDTKRFRDALFASTLPAFVLDAVSSQISTLKTSTCLRLTDGTFYGFEGCSDIAGCCDGSCTHVWNYAQALPYLFPALQRSMRQADFTHAMRADGMVQFRLPLPLGTKPDWKFLPAADGQMGTVIQVYREWLISGDKTWLNTMWPLTRQALEFAWKYWDPNQDGVMEGVQHNTYDIEYYGPNPLSGLLYLGALRAAEELAKVMGESDKADTYRDLFQRGSRWLDGHLFNGQYYEQQVAPRALDLIPATEACLEFARKREKDDKFPDWPQWQMGRGCLADQLLGQWYARMLGLGSLVNQKHARSAAQSIFRHNWQTDFTNHATLSAPRLYATNEEKGLLVCTWPNGGRPGYPTLYADEVWTGIEYAAAAALICEGLVAEGLSIVRGARERYTGEHRNPWDEIECGHHYARGMASYSLLLALSGFQYSAPAQRLEFAPRVSAPRFAVFFSVGSGWGMYRQKITGHRLTAEVRVESGSLELAVLCLAAPKKARAATACCAGQEIGVTGRHTGGAIELAFAAPVKIMAGETLVVHLR